MRRTSHLTLIGSLGATLLLLSAGTRPGQMTASAATGMASMEMPAQPVPPEKLLPPVAMTGIGNSALEITTTNSEARIWFTQGLNLFHDFWDYEASRAFEQSIRKDPNCAMCYWGLFQSESFRGDSDEFAATALGHAEAHARHATPAEKLYIKAAAEDWKQHLADEASDAKGKKPKPRANGWSVEGAQTKHIDSKETKTYRKLVALQPEDVQAKIFLAESLIDGFDSYGTPKPGTAEAQRILAAVLAQHPDDSAANHYWIHAQEPGQHPELALDSARKLGRLAPASGHMVHMPGHIFYRVGDYEDARIAFTDSMHVDEAYMRSQHVAPEDDWNYVHNLMYLIADLLEEGRLEEATAISGKLTRARGDSGTTLYRFSTRDGMTRLNPLLPVALRSGDWAAATALLEASHPDPALVTLVGLRSSLLDYTRGMTALAGGDTVAAADQSKSLDDALAKTPAEPQMVMPGMGGAGKPNPNDAAPAPIHSFMDVAALELRASVQMAQGATADADTTFGKAADAERALGYHEPPMYIRPVGETRGDALMRAHRYINAKVAYQAALAERPNSGFPLFGIAQADVAEKNTAAATADYFALLKAWRYADRNLPQLVAARAWLASQTVLARR